MHRGYAEMVASNRLKLNQSKIEFSWVTTSRCQQLIIRNPINVCGSYTVSSSCVKLLGVYIHSGLSFNTHVSKTVSSGYLFSCGRSMQFEGVYRRRLLDLYSAPQGKWKRASSITNLRDLHYIKIMDPQGNNSIVVISTVATEAVPPMQKIGPCPRCPNIIGI